MGIALCILGAIAAVGAMWLWLLRRRDRAYLREYEALEAAAKAEEAAERRERQQPPTVSLDEAVRLAAVAREEKRAKPVAPKPLPKPAPAKPAYTPSSYTPSRSSSDDDGGFLSTAISAALDVSSWSSDSSSSFDSGSSGSDFSGGGGSSGGGGASGDW